MALKVCLDWWLRWICASLVFFAQLGGIGLLFLVAFMSDSGSIKWGDLAIAAAWLLGNLTLAAVIVGTAGALVSALPVLFIRRWRDERSSSPSSRRTQPKSPPRKLAPKAVLFSLPYLVVGAGATLVLGFSLLTVAINGSAAIRRGDIGEAVIGTTVFTVLGAGPALLLLRWSIRRFRVRIGGSQGNEPVDPRFNSGSEL